MRSAGDQAELGQHRGMDPARELAQLVGGEPQLLAHARRAARGVGLERGLEHLEVEPDREQAVLGAVVEVALEPAARLVGGGDDPRARGAQLALALRAGR